MQVTATIYAILIAFVIVDAYSQVRDSQADVSSKAASLAVIYENSRGLPEPGADEIRDGSARLRADRDRSGHPAARGERRPGPRGRPPARAALPDRAAARTRDRGRARRVRQRPSAPSTTSSRRAPSCSTQRGRRSRTTLIFLLVVIGLVVMAVATLLDTQHRRLAPLHPVGARARHLADDRARDQPGLPVQRADPGHRRTHSRVRPLPRRALSTHAGRRSGADGCSDAVDEIGEAVHQLRLSSSEKLR